MDAFCLDLSPEMAATAQHDHPGLRTEPDLADLNLTTGSGVLAFWPLLGGFHLNDDGQHTAPDYAGRAVAIDTHRRQPRVKGLLRETDS